MAIPKRGARRLATIELGRDPVSGRRLRMCVTAVTLDTYSQVLPTLQDETAPDLDA